MPERCLQFIHLKELLHKFFPITNPHFVAVFTEYPTENVMGITIHVTKPPLPKNIKDALLEMRRMRVFRHKERFGKM